MKYLFLFLLMFSVMFGMTACKTESFTAIRLCSDNLSNFYDYDDIIYQNDEYSIVLSYQVVIVKES